MKKRFVDLGKDIFIYGFMTGLSQVTGLLLLPIFTRVFSTDDYGIIDIIATITTIVTIIAGLSLPSAIYRYYHDARDERELNSFISTTTVFIAIFGLSMIFMGIILSDSIAELLLDNSQFGIYITRRLIYSQQDLYLCI